jgi:hemoglobin
MRTNISTTTSSFSFDFAPKQTPKTPGGISRGLSSCPITAAFTRHYEQLASLRRRFCCKFGARLPGRGYGETLDSEGQMVDELYALIGGKRTVWAATEAFYRRVLSDDTLSPFFEKTDMAQLHARQSMFISMLLGGQIVYTGKDIAAAHRHVRARGLNDGHFDQALQEVGVPDDKIDEVSKLLESKRTFVLNPGE